MAQENILNCEYSKSSQYDCLINDANLKGNITKIIGNQISNFEVESLVIQKSNMEKIPQNLAEFFPNLVKLNITKTNLKSIDKEDLKNFPKLEILTLNFTQIHKLPEKLFEFTPNVKEVNIENSLIEFVNFHTFDGLKNLKTIKFNNSCAVLESKSRKIQNSIVEIISKCTEVDKFFCFFEVKQNPQRYACRIKNYDERVQKTAVIGKKG